MAYTDIDKPSDYFNTKLYTGNGSTQSITGVGFQPDFVWIKNRTAAENHFIFDSVRGALNVLKSNSNGTAGDTPDSLTAFTSDGFNLGNLEDTNRSGNAVASWNWLASNTTASNTDGSITSTVSANTTSGFSIVSYTGTGSNATVGHGLGSAPKVMFVKRRSSSSDWTCFFKVLGNTKRLILNSTGAVETATTWWNSTDPTSSVFSLGTSGGVNASSETYIAYCFAEKKGFSKFGSYTGNGNADGTFVYTGFKPAFAIFKNTSGTGDWLIYDNKRNPSNVTNKGLKAHSSDAEASYDNLDILSNGFKLRRVTSSLSTSGDTYIFMAFAENPFVTSTGIPTTAR